MYASRMTAILIFVPGVEKKDKSNKKTKKNSRATASLTGQR